MLDGTEQEITLDGYDGSELCEKINVFYDYHDRFLPAPGTKKSIIAQVKHGERGTLLKYEHPACQIEVDGKTGWLTFFFIKELKETWQKKRLKLEKQAAN